MSERSVVARLKGDVAGYTSAMKQASKETEALGKAAAGTAGSLDRQSQAADDAARATQSNASSTSKGVAASEKQAEAAGKAADSLNKQSDAADKAGKSATSAAESEHRAAEKAATASRRQADAAGRLRVEQEKLQEKQKSSSTTASQLAAAEDAVAKAQRSAEAATDAAVQATQEHVQASRQATEAQKQYAQATEHAQAKTQSFSKTVTDNRDAMETVAKPLLLAGGAMLGLQVAAAKTGVSYNTLQQTSRAAMTTLLGGAREANAQMDKLDSFARTSPFSKATFITAQQQMLAFGIETRKVIPYLEAVQDAVAAAGGSNQQLSEIVFVMSQIQAAGKITGQDLMQFGQRGINAAELIGSQMGRTGAQIREDITAGALGAEEALDALAAGMVEKYDGAAANVKNTFTGAIDRVMAAWRDMSSLFAEPLVGPESGGLAIAGLNTLADGMRGVEKAAQLLPEPVRLVGTGLGLVASVAPLAAGAFLMLAPKIIETQTALATLAGQGGLLGKTATGMQAVSNNLGTLIKVAGGVAAITAVTVALAKIAESSYLDDIDTGMGRVSLAVAKASKEIEGLDSVFMNRHGEELIRDVDDIGSAIDRTFNKDASDKFNDWGENLMNSLTGVEGSSHILMDSWSRLDTQLSNMVTNGDAELAANVFGLIAEQAEAQGVSIDRLKLIFPEYIDQLDAAEAAALGAAESTFTYSEAASAALEILDDFKDASYSAAASFIDLSAGIDDGKVSLTSWLSELEKQNEALVSWAENMQELRENGLDEGLIRELEAMGPAGAQLVRELADASESEIARANDAWRSGRDAIDEYVESMGLVPPIDIKADKSDLEEQLKEAEDQLERLNDMEPSPVVDASITLLEERIEEAKQILAGIDGSTATAHVNVTTNMEQLRKQYPGIFDAANPQTAPGVTKPRGSGNSSRFASGGPIYGPGTETSDSIPAWLSDGEHVLTAKEVKGLGGHRAVERMRQLARHGVAPRFAKGGAVNVAQKRVDQLQTQLTNARRAKTDAGTKAAKQAQEVRIRALTDQVNAAKRELTAAKAAQSALEKRTAEEKRAAEAEAARKGRVRTLSQDFATDVRRGSFQSQVTGGLSGAYSGVDQMIRLSRNDDLSKSSRSSLSSQGRQFEANLKKLYAQAESLDEKLSDAQDKAKELEGIQNSVAQGLLRDRTLDFSATDSYNADTGAWTHNVGGVAGAARNMAADASQLKAFAKKLQQLVQLGLPGSLIQEIAGMGVVQGTAAAEEFLKATETDVKAYVTAYEDYESAANQAGKYVTNAFYKGGVDAANGLVAGLESQQAAVEKQILAIAKAMESTIRSALQIKSPSRVMYELGRNTTEGFRLAIAEGVAGVAEEAALLGTAAIPAVQTPTVGSASTQGVALAAGGEVTPAVDEGWESIESTTLETLAAMQQATTLAYQLMDAETLASLETRRAGSVATNQTLLADQQAIQASMVAGNQATAQQVLTDQQNQQALLRQGNLATWQTVNADTATQMEALKAANLAGHTSVKDTSLRLLTEMRQGAFERMSLLNSEFSGNLAVLNGIGADGFATLRATGVAEVQGLRAGINAQMGQAQPELTTSMNRLTDVLNRWGGKVNDAFGDVGVKLPSVQKLATGGEVHGPGTATSDSIPARLSRGEFVVNAEATRRHVGLLHAINGPKGQGYQYYKAGVPAFRDGGMVWPSLWGAVKGQFGSKVRLHSAYRPGSITATGNRSYHGRGMAIDITPDMEIFNWIRGKYGANTAELIYSPANNRQIHNGKPHMYSGVTRSMHFDHIHWAMRQMIEGGAAGFGGYSDKLLKLAGVKPGDDLQKSFAEAAQILGQKYASETRTELDGNTFLQQLGYGVTSSAIPSLVEKARKYAEQAEMWQDMDVDMGNHSGGDAVERWRSTVEQALQIMGQPESLANTVLRRLRQESGGNARAINNWDSNARRGTPSKGLMQVIDPTYRAYRHPSYDNGVYDPLSNILASMRYAVSRYGSLSKAYNRRGGYRLGTESALPGWHWVGEDGPELMRMSGGEKIAPHAASVAALRAQPTAGMSEAQVDRLVAAIKAQKRSISIGDVSGTDPEAIVTVIEQRERQRSVYG